MRNGAGNLAGLTLSRLCAGKPCLLRTAINHSTTKEFFAGWFKNSLLPLLKLWQTVTLDNASFHSAKLLGKLLEGSGINLLFLPTYSPYFNPIEHLWANSKRAVPDIISRFESLQNAILAYFAC
jgi:transposase